MKWYKYDIRNMSNAEYDIWYSLMSEAKKRRVDRFRFIDDKKRTVAGEMLARKAIAEWCRVIPQSIIFDINEHGKPYAKDLPVEFNISHSGDMVVCGVDDRAVGIDVEQIRPIDLSIAKRICTKNELMYLFGHAPVAEDFACTPNHEVLMRFFEIWTAKEAYGKCNGTGVSCLGAEVLEIPKINIALENYYVCIVKK